jgi:signal peptidase I
MKRRSDTGRKGGQPMASSTENKDGWVETIKTIVYALLIAGIFRTLFFQPFWIPSGSMKDTLLIGDFLFVNKMAYGYSRHSCPFSMCPFSGRIFGNEPERGDVVVFRHPVNNSDFIKRVVGLPGDRIQMQNGVLYINGQAAPQRDDGSLHRNLRASGPGRRPAAMHQPPGPAWRGLRERARDRDDAGRHRARGAQHHQCRPGR